MKCPKDILHETVENSAAGKTFWYCRQCKDEANLDEARARCEYPEGFDDPVKLPEGPKRIGWTDLKGNTLNGDFTLPEGFYQGGVLDSMAGNPIKASKLTLEEARKTAKAYKVTVQDWMEYFKK